MPRTETVGGLSSMAATMCNRGVRERREKQDSKGEEQVTRESVGLRDQILRLSVVLSNVDACNLHGVGVGCASHLLAVQGVIRLS